MPIHFIIGVDEVGRGPLLGDVVVCACIFPNEILEVAQVGQPLKTAQTVHLLPHHPLAALTDSKKLSEKTRNKLFPMIQQTAVAYDIIKISAQVIDQLNILQATLFGMQQAVARLIQTILHTSSRATFSVMVDGNKLPLLNNIPNFEKILFQQAIIKGDSKHVTISAASVLAKVSRDQDMLALAKLYPEYGIEKHKGYPTPLHLQAIEAYGILPVHRRSFAPIKHKIIEN